jgi:molecular chaperone GrpE
MDKRFNDVENEPQENVSPDGKAGQGTKLTSNQEEKAGPAEAPDSIIEKLQAQIADKDKELAELKDRYLRALAENENARKRIRQQSEESVRLQRENLLRELLPVVDNLERAVDAARGGGNGKPIVEGVEMVLRSLLDFLKAQGVTQLTSIGQPFDPQRHEAVDQIESSRHPPNTVVNEFHRGYQIGDRLLRPARVAVAKGASESKNGGAGNGGGVETA